MENPSDQLHPKAWVLGVFTDDESIAFRQEDVERERVIREPFDGRELLVTWAGSPRAHWADNSETPRQVLGFWFAWHDFHPDTRLWGRLLAEVVLPREAGGLTRVVFSEAVDQERLAAHVPSGVTARWIDERTLELAGSRPFTIPPGDYGRNGTALAEELHVPLGRSCCSSASSPRSAGSSAGRICAESPTTSESWGVGRARRSRTSR